MRNLVPLKKISWLPLWFGAWALLLWTLSGPLLGDDSRNPLPGRDTQPPEDRRSDGNQLPDRHPPREETPDEEHWMDPEDWSDDEEQEGWRSFRRDEPHVIAAFRQVVAEPSFSTVEVICDGRQQALGAVVSEDGEILTKASELSGEIVCVFRDGRRLPAKILAEEDEYDLALLKVQAQQLRPIVWSDSPELPLGSWLATSGPQEDPVAIGVVSVAPRRILPVNGILGIHIDEGDRGPVITKVIPGSGAEAAGLHVSDVVLRVNGRRVETSEELVDVIRQYRPGTRVRLLLDRDGDELEITASLGHRSTDLDHDLGAYQNSLGGKLSIRRAGFPSVMQHDTALAPRECGGPIVDLDGRAIGINIARAGRVNSYAITAATVQELLAQLRSGELASDETLPPDLQRVGLEQQIQALRTKLAEREAEIEAAAEAQDNAAEHLDEVRQQLAEAHHAAAQLLQRLEELEAEQAALDEADDENAGAENADSGNHRRRVPSLRNKSR